jgi:enamine deaminase RidA (YjgF/YER057c/UK114 family)
VEFVEIQDGVVQIVAVTQDVQLLLRTAGFQDVTIVVKCRLYIKVARGIHALMRDSNNIDPIFSDFVEDQMHTFRKAIVAGLYIRTRFAESRVF